MRRIYEPGKEPRSGLFHRLLTIIQRVLGWLAKRMPASGNMVMLPQRLFVQRLFVIVGTPGSGKDLLIRAVNDLGAQHARIVPKHTSRVKRWDDGDEMICPGDPCYDLDGCDITYENYGDVYGIKSSQIWGGLRDGIFQVVVVSNVKAINELREIFGELVLLVYVHSEVDAEEYRRREAKRKEAKREGDFEYLKRRIEQYQLAREVFLENFLAFNHVLINSGPPENLIDQMFRLFRAYEHGAFSSATKSLVSKRIWTHWTEMPLKEPKIIGFNAEI